MAAAPSSACASVAELRRVLEEILDATVSADIERLGACESRLASVMATLPPARSADGVALLGGGAHDEARLRTEIDAARVALWRCRRVGAAMVDITSAVLGAAGIVTGYDRAGLAATRAVHGAVAARG